eukprot:8105700-Pyramimonas_sp.AAC.1
MQGIHRPYVPPTRATARVHTTPAPKTRSKKGTQGIKGNTTRFHGSSCANNGGGALRNAPETLHK